MSTPSQFVGDSLEELLVALAEGFREAQAALDAGVQYDVAGRPLPAYKLPYLDFQVNVEIETSSNVGGRPLFKLRKENRSGNSTDRVQSSVSGRLVAVPAGGGLPLNRLELRAGTMKEGRVALVVRAATDAGEAAVSHSVELNIDDQASSALSNGFKREPGTRLKSALVTTGEDGSATTELLVDEKQSEAVLVVVASLGGSVGRAAFTVKGGR